MPDAAPSIKPFAKTLTRDHYSFGLVMWFSLFLDMPYGPEDSATEEAVRDWKLNIDATSALREHITIRAPRLSKVCRTYSYSFVLIKKKRKENEKKKREKK